MNRREVITKGGLGLAVALVPFSVKARPVNTFSESDTPEQRLRKFNKLTGLELRFAYLDARHQYQPHDRFYGRRCLMRKNGQTTGFMDKETFMHWTAQVALGYRLRMEQE